MPINQTAFICGVTPIPPQGARHIMTEFLFIDYQDDNPRNRSVTKAKLGFAQRRSHRNQRLAAIGRLKSSSLIPRQPFPLPYNPPNREGVNRGRAESSQKDGSYPGATTAGTEGRQRRQIAPAPVPGSPKTMLGDSFIDPFSSTAFPMTEFMNSFFHHRTWILLSV